jgi:DNA adenine methylase
MKPIVKWAGGKGKLLGELLARVPDEVRVYREPFAGGAALFFALAAEAKAGRRRLDRAVLADENVDLVACYRAVRDDVDGVIEALGGYRYDRELFYATRERDTASMSDVERAARLVFLNRTCFNGLWRVNSSGRFNVPFGRYKNPRILDEAGLRAAHDALAAAELVHGDFTLATKDAAPGDFVYFDPPYVPVSRTASFTAYARRGFGSADQERLRVELSRLKGLGVRALLSNADTPETRALYADHAAWVVAVPRAINSDASKRGAAAELLVTTWEAAGVRERPRAYEEERPHGDRSGRAASPSGEG